MTVNLYNCEPTTIDVYLANGTNIGGSTTNIIRKSSKMIILLETDSPSTNNACNLPDNSEVGDIIELYTVFNADHGGAEGAYVYLTSGEVFINQNEISKGVGHGTIFRKVTDTQWGRVSNT